MTRYAIKNKEGKYYQTCYNQPPFTDDLFDANKYQYKEEAEKILNNSFTLVDTLEVVEITMIESDLEKQIRKQVCDEIREKLKKQILPAGGNWLVFYDVKETNDLLDQIEQGERER